MSTFLARTLIKTPSLEGEGGGGEKGEEMTQTLYAHMNKQTKKTPNLSI
jgi:hypothetical protein